MLIRGGGGRNDLTIAPIKFRTDNNIYKKNFCFFIFEIKKMFV